MARWLSNSAVLGVLKGLQHVQNTKTKHKQRRYTDKNINVTKKKEEDFIFFILLSCRLFTHILAEEGAPFDAII